MYMIRWMCERTATGDSWSKKSISTMAVELRDDRSGNTTKPATGVIFLGLLETWSKRKGEMTQAPPEEVTGLLLAWSNGDQAALDKLIPLVYAELHRLARRSMRREKAGHTLQTSALVTRPTYL